MYRRKPFLGEKDSGSCKGRGENNMGVGKSREEFPYNRASGDGGCELSHRKQALQTHLRGLAMKAGARKNEGARGGAVGGRKKKQQGRADKKGRRIIESTVTSRTKGGTKLPRDEERFTILARKQFERGRAAKSSSRMKRQKCFSS